jgi:DNA-binding FadR family transcriptional regulator
MTYFPAAIAAASDCHRSGIFRPVLTPIAALFARLQPGGARVCPPEAASLDVIGYMMSQGDLPDIRLVDQILSVLNTLVLMAADATLENASDAEIDHIRALSRTLNDEQLDQDAHMLARVDLIKTIMIASENLVCRLIAKSLLDQFLPNLTAIEGHAKNDLEAYKTYTRQLDSALAERDRDAVRTIFKGIFDLNRDSLMQAMQAARHDIALQSIERTNQSSEVVPS